MTPPNIHRIVTRLKDVAGIPWPTVAWWMEIKGLGQAMAELIADAPGDLRDLLAENERRETELRDARYMLAQAVEHLAQHEEHSDTWTRAQVLASYGVSEKEIDEALYLWQVHELGITPEIPMEDHYRRSEDQLANQTRDGGPPRGAESSPRHEALDQAARRAYLDAIAKRVRLASPGPWRHDPNASPDDPAGGYVWSANDQKVTECSDDEDYTVAECGAYAYRDAAFIASARTDVEWLLAEVERLSAVQGDAHGDAA